MGRHWPTGGCRAKTNKQTNYGYRGGNVLEDQGRNLKEVYYINILMTGRLRRKSIVRQYA
jgi:hypothetical protein